MEYKRNLKRKKRQEKSKPPLEPERKKTWVPRDTTSPSTKDGRTYTPLARPAVHAHDASLYPPPPNSHHTTYHSLGDKPYIYRREQLRDHRRIVSPEGRSDASLPSSVLYPYRDQSTLSQPWNQSIFQSSVNDSFQGRPDMHAPLIPAGAYVNPAFFRTMRIPEQQPFDITNDVQQQIDIIKSSEARHPGTQK